jgi:hypothetical protein
MEDREDDSTAADTGWKAIEDTGDAETWMIV